MRSRVRFSVLPQFLNCVRNGSEDFSFEKVRTFKYVDSLVTNQNSLQEEGKCRLKAGNSCYYSVQTLLSSRLLSKNFKIKVILPVVLYGYETWSLALREKRWLRIFENRIVRRIFGVKRDEKGEWRRLHNEELHSFTVFLI